MDKGDKGSTRGNIAGVVQDLGWGRLVFGQTFGDPDDLEVPPYTVERDGLGFICDYRHSTKLLADSMGAEQFAVLAVGDHLDLERMQPAELRDLLAFLMHEQ